MWRMPRRLLTVALTALTTLALASGTAAAAPGGGNKNSHCGRIDKISVPGAEMQVSACLDDLTTTGLLSHGNGLYTDAADFAGLAAAGTTPPAAAVPGIQIDGYFPDTSGFNTKHGWNHDAQFVIRMPDDWNGGLVVSGAPGTRTQYANDQTIGDYALSQGYAFASIDKGNSGLLWYTDGATPGDAILEGHQRVTELTTAAKKVLKQRYTKLPTKTYAMGVSNGGYLVRWQLENNPELYDGGVDWEGTLYTADENLLTYLPTGLKEYPKYATGDLAAHQKMIDAGFEPGSEYLWAYHYGFYWDITQRSYRDEVDPSYDQGTSGPVVILGQTYPVTMAGYPYCAVSGQQPCDADYDYAARYASTPELRAAIDKIKLTGDIGKPLITIHGTHDTLLPISVDSDVYDQMIEDAGKAGLHRYYRFEYGNHVDGLYTAFPQIRPLLPCARASFDAVVAWTTDGTEPPADATLPNPNVTMGPDGTPVVVPVEDVVNTCSLSA